MDLLARAPQAVRQEPETDRVSCVVAIPVNNERERIIGCLDALAGQMDVPGGALGILLFLNNCTDATREVVEQWMPASPWPVRLLEQDSASASAGWARRRAMESAAAWLADTAAPGGLLLTTDADSRVPPDWVALNRAAIATGADAVAGRVVFDPDELATMPPGVQRRHALECAYEALLAEIEARIAPRRGNPWPCHWTKSGASIAVSVDAYRRVGGLPRIGRGEDHAFIDLLVASGFVVRHASHIAVTTSGRLAGRARGGTAETLQRWCRDPDSPCDARLRRVGRFVWGNLSGRQKDHGLVAHLPARRPMRSRELPRQIARAHLLLRVLRGLEAYRGGRRRAAPMRLDPPKQLSMP